MAASRPNPTGERGLLYSLQAVAGLGLTMEIEELTSR